ncbi:MAG: hypothetical protein AB7L94_10525 [Kofleriaceae bacterium]
MGPGFRPSIHPGDAVSISELTSLSRHVAREPRRRHRWLTAPSGWLFFACIFLPAWKPCSTAEALPMAIVPVAWPPYLAGLMIALTVSSTVRREIEARGALLLVMIRFSAIAVAGWALVALVDDGVTIATAIAVKIGTVVALLVPWRATERAIAATSVVTSAALIVFAWLLAHDRHAVWGAYASVIAASSLFVGCVWWWVELWCAEARVKRG